MKDVRTIILAAGKGTRMKSNRPKVLHEVCGQPIIQYVLDAAKQAGSLKNYVVVGHKSDVVKQALSDDEVIVEQKELLGTAHAVRCASLYLKRFSGSILILCGDTPLLKKDTIKRLIGKHKRSKAACSLLTAVVDNPNGYGRIIRDNSGVIMAIREEKDALGCEKNIAEINVGVYCFNAAYLFKTLKQVGLNAKKKEFYLTDVIELLVDGGQKVETLKIEDYAQGLGVNSREDLAAAESILRRRIIKKLMSEGVTIIDPQTTYIDANVKIGKDTIIRPFTFIEGNVRIGSDCSIGPFARLRPGTKIGNNVEIGNFTEVSRTKIADRTVMKHFSFLGDTTVGSNVNIGAGTVTANYDGQHKNATKIFDQAFIGSNSVLIAPVSIGSKAVIGAGSVVTKGTSVPAGHVAVGVPAKIMSRRTHK